jgi:glucan phosphoethanolaminetransferase (alkaline phosphatase superfamily)
MNKSNNQEGRSEINSTKILLPYTLVMLALVVIMQIINIVRKDIYSTTSSLSLVIVAAYYFYFNAKNHARLKKIRFGSLVAHFIGYSSVNLSYLIASFIIYWNSTYTIIGEGSVSIPKEASGALYFMPIFWGFGLLIHIIASVSNRGFEEK